MHYNDPQVRAMVFKLRKQSMLLYTRVQAGEYLGVSDYTIGLMIEKGQLTPQNKEHLEKRKSEGRRGFPRFSMDELRRCKKARQEEEQKLEEERRKRAEEAAQLRAEKASKGPGDAVPVSLSGISMVSAIDLNELKKRLDNIEAFMSKLDTFMDRLGRSMM